MEDSELYEFSVSYVFSRHLLNIHMIAPTEFMAIKLISDIYCEGKIFSVCECVKKETVEDYVSSDVP